MNYFGHKEIALRIEGDIVWREKVAGRSRRAPAAEPSQQFAGRVQYTNTSTRRLWAWGGRPGPHTGQISQFGHHDVAFTVKRELAGASDVLPNIDKRARG